MILLHIYSFVLPLLAFFSHLELNDVSVFANCWYLSSRLARCAIDRGANFVELSNENVGYSIQPWYLGCICGGTMHDCLSGSQVAASTAAINFNFILNAIPTPSSLLLLFVNCCDVRDSWNFCLFCFMFYFLLDFA